MRSTGKLRAYPVTEGKTALFDGDEHFITLPSSEAAAQVKKLIDDARACCAPPEQIVYAVAKALGVTARWS